MTDNTQEIDPKLDDPAYVKTIFENNEAPAKPKLQWGYRHLDFGIYDESTGFFGVFVRGPN